MLNEQELNKLAQMIPAKARYAVIASWADVEETAEEWDDFEHATTWRSPTLPPNGLTARMHGTRSHAPTRMR